jgi:hypothetical protein
MRWVPIPVPICARKTELTKAQTRQISDEMEATDQCEWYPKIMENPAIKNIERLPDEPKPFEKQYRDCLKMRTQLRTGDIYIPAEKITPKYLITLLSFAGGAFAIVFALVMLFPRYLAWLRK